MRPSVPVHIKKLFQSSISLASGQMNWYSICLSHTELVCFGECYATDFQDSLCKIISLKEHVALDRSSWSLESVCNRLL